MALLKQAQRQQAAKIAFREQQNTNLTPANQPPQFGTPLKDLSGLLEGQTATFQCSITPANDSTMKIIWMLKGKPVQQGKISTNSFVKKFAF